MWNAGCQHGWNVLAPTDADGDWADSRAVARVSTAAPRSGRHSLRVTVPSATMRVVKSIPIDGGKRQLICLLLVILMLHEVSHGMLC